MGFVCPAPHSSFLFPFSFPFYDEFSKYSKECVRLWSPLTDGGYHGHPERDLAEFLKYFLGLSISHPEKQGGKCPCG